jgi:putative acyl-CoA dehydrogenase
MDNQPDELHRPRGSFEVFNQTPALTDYNLFDTDAALKDAVAREWADGYFSELSRIGSELGSAANFDAGRLANQFPPVLRTHDPRGNRIDRIEFHPAWHGLMEGMIARGFHAAPWPLVEEGPAYPNVARAAGYLMQAQIEQGSLCPVTMTYGAIPVLRKDPSLAAEWVPKLLSRNYDPRDLPCAQKDGALIGMGMTEKQGGSDVRANTTWAERQVDGSYRITGHKWFFSAPQCDAHLVLAQTGNGLSCFFMPRFEPDGSKNAIHIQRLKDKVGNRSNASSEVEFHRAWAHLLGEEGRGVATILEMGTYTRLDCVIGTAGMMRQAVVQAIHHARHRRVFGKLLIDQPLMQSVLADLAIESEAATALALRLSRAFDSQDEHEIAFRRVMTSAAKFWVCKRGPELAAEALEVLGGNGYVEEGPLARIYREMPLNSIWEGSGNVMCLDVLRAFSKSAAAVEFVLAEFEAQRGKSAAFDAALGRLESELSGAKFEEEDARRLAQALAVLLQASLLLQSESNPMAQAYCATRLAESGAKWGTVYGLLPHSFDRMQILDRAWSE